MSKAKFSKHTIKRTPKTNQQIVASETIHIDRLSTMDFSDSTNGLPHQCITQNVIGGKNG